MLPPSPPSPPSGPPKGMARSRRKLTQPLPPSPASTRMVASSTNFIDLSYTGHSREQRALHRKNKGPVVRGLYLLTLASGRRDDIDERAALRTTDAEFDLAIDLGVDRVVLAQAGV